MTSYLRRLLRTGAAYQLADVLYPLPAYAHDDVAALYSRAARRSILRRQVSYEHPLVIGHLIHPGYLRRQFDRTNA